MHTIFTQSSRLKRLSARTLAYGFYVLGVLAALAAAAIVVSAQA